MTAGRREFVIRISSTHPDAEAIVREATRKIACEVGWGDDQFASIETTEEHGIDPPSYLAGYEMEPGNVTEREDSI